MAYCRKCGIMLAEGAKFCRKCGTEVRSVMMQPSNQQPLSPQQPVMQQPVNPQPQNNRPMYQQNAAPNVQANINRVIGTAGQVVNPVNMQNFAGAAFGNDHYSDTFGEMVVGMIDESPMGNMGKLATGFENFRSMGPIDALLSGIVTHFLGFFNMFTSLRALLCTVVLTILWIVLDGVNRSGNNNFITDILSFLSYSTGSSAQSAGNSFGGFVGSICGRATIAAALSSILYGGLGRSVKGIKTVFSNGFSLGSFLSGLGISGFAYQFVAGKAGGYGFVIMFSAILMAFQSASNRSGFLRTLAGAFSSGKNNNGVNIVRPSAFSGFIWGSVSGSVFAFITSCFEGRVSVWIYLALTVIGMIINAILSSSAKKKGSRYR